MKTRLVFALFVTFLAPGMALASSGEEGGPSALDYGFKTFNIVVLVGALVYILRPIVRQFLDDRKAGIKKRLETAERERDQARTALADVEARMESVREQIEAIAGQARQDGERIAAQTQSRTQNELEQLKAQNTRLVDDRLSQAKKELKAYAARLAVEEAEALLKTRLTDPVKLALFDQSLDKLKESTDGGTS